MKRFILIAIAFSLVINIILIAYVAYKPKNTNSIASLSPQDYPLLSKRIFVENQNDLIINFVELRNKLNSYAKTQKLTDEKANDSILFGLYFEYLPSGISIGINEKTPFVAASLLKVPIIMGAYKYIEAGKMQEDTVLTIQEKHLDPSFGELWKKGIGAKISVSDAIKITLQQSDNTSNAVLFDNIPATTLDEVTNYLDIPNEVEGNTPVVSAKNYSSILRSLYLSTYLSPEHSNKLLKQLTDTPFTDKIRAGVPNDVIVAHKIGVHESTNSEKSIFTDCGIVFVPKRPYILCAMMRDTEENTRIHMSELSRIIYEYITQSNQEIGK